MPPTTCLRALSLPRPSASASLFRSFSTTSPVPYKQDTPRQNPPFHPAGPGKKLRPIPSATASAPHIPPYPHGERQTYHQANSGLYGSASIRYGNTVSERNEIKNRRSWRPNVQQKRLWSQSLNCFVKTRLTTRVLRTIDKVGGLDEYLLGVKSQRIKDLGPWGWRLRWRIMQTDSLQKRFQRESKALGLPHVDRMWRKAGLHELPDGKKVDDKGKQAYLEETDAAIAAEKEIALESEASLTAGDEGFMKEAKTSEQRVTA